MTYVRQHCKKEEASGKDEGGYFKYVKTEDVPRKLRERMKRCAGCRDNFYNRANCTGNHCWSLNDNENFAGRGRPLCYH